MKRKQWDDKKVYTSFNEIPPRDYMYFPKGTIEVSKPGKFSRVEIQHLVISMTLLTLAFAFALTPFNLRMGFNTDRFPLGIIASFLAIATAFFFHEISHKFIAQKNGLWAEYRMFPQGLFLAFILGISLGFVFAAPGAVMFRGGSRDFETGKIALAGPLANIIISLIMLPIFLFVVFEDSTLGYIVGLVCLINAFLAVFNLLPFGPLDGTKIIRWSPTIWIVMLIISVGLLITIMSKIPVYN